MSKFDCSKCEYCVADDQKQLECRKNPPQVVVVVNQENKNNLLTVFPRVVEGAFCNQFKEIIEERKVITAEKKIYKS